MKRLAFLVLGFVIQTHLSHGQFRPSESGEREVVAVFTDLAPKLDGLLDDEPADEAETETEPEAATPSS